MTRAVRQVANPVAQRIVSEEWYLLNPPTGTNNIVVNFSTAVDGITMGAMSLTGVQQSAPASASGSGNNNAPSVNITTLTNNAWVIDTLVVDNNSTTVTPNAAQTRLYQQIVSFSHVGSASRKTMTTAGATTMQWSLSSNRVWASVAISLAPSSGGTSLKQNRPIRLVQADGSKKFNVDKGRTGSYLPGAAKPSGFDFLFAGLIKVFDALTGVEEAHASETLDFTTFVENDPTNQITETPACINYTNIESLFTNAQVYKAYTTSGNFNHAFDGMLASSTQTFAGQNLIWGVSADANKTLDDWTDGVYVGLKKNGSSSAQVYLGGPGITNQIFSGLSLNQRYYFTVTRSGNTVTMQVYSNSARTTLVTTKSVTETTASFPYIYGFTTQTGSFTNRHMTGDSCNLTNNSSTGLSAPVLNNPVPGDGQVGLSWNAVSGATSYTIKYGTVSGSHPNSISVGNVTGYTVSPLTNGTTYYFVVIASNAVGNSPDSNEKSATPQVPAPLVPTLNSATADDAKVTLSWTAVNGATGYKVKYGTTSGSYPTIIDAGNVTSRDVTGLTNGTTYYFVVTAYNAGGESAPSNELNALPLTSTPIVDHVEYNAMGQVISVTYGNGTVTTNTYDPLNFRLKRIYTVNASAQVLQDLNYTYDPAGDILTITDNSPGGTATQSFQYDELNRLTFASNQNYGVKTYSYDAIGNITSKDGKSYTYMQNGAGPHAVTSLSDGSQYFYDLNGNMITKVEGGNTYQYGYDVENRLINVKKNGVNIADYSYDGDGGRVKKTVYSPSTVTTTYVGSLYEETAGTGINFVYLGDTRIASIDTTGRLLYYLSDHLGGSNVITDSSGVKKELTEYDPYGQYSRHEKYGTSQEVAMFYFTGKKLDDETGLYYYGARYYDPSLGRFITPDTIVQDPYDPQTLNRYSYAGNNPVNNTDPTGHSWLKNIFKSLNKIFDKFVGWLEKVTNSKWYVNVEVGQSYQFQDFKTLAQDTGKVGFTTITQPWQFGVGIYRWANDPRFRILKNPSYGVYEDSSIEDYDNVFVNGILNNEQYAFENAEKANGYQYKSLKVTYNPTDGPLADVTEAFLQKLFFTSSVDRQLARALAGHKGITLSGHSQGAIIASNALLNLGLRGERDVVNKVRYDNTQISAPRAYLSAAFAGVKHITYGSRYFDPSNVAGPNFTEPLKFLSGLPGLYLPFGATHHGIEQ